MNSYIYQLLFSYVLWLITQYEITLQVSPNSYLRAFSFSSGYIKCTAWLDLQRSWRGSIEGSKSWEFGPDSYRENRAKKPRFKKRNQLQRMFKKGMYVYGSDWVVILVSIYLTGEECFKHADWLARKWLASTSHLQAAEETKSRVNNLIHDHFLVYTPFLLFVCSTYRKKFSPQCRWKWGIRASTRLKERALSDYKA